MTHTDQLGQLVAVLDRLAAPEDRPRLDTIRERLTVGRLRILVAGEAKRGKSTLVNSLLRRDILPTGVTPVTAVATTVLTAQDQAEFIDVVYLDGRRERHKLDELSTYVTERDNPENVRDVSHVDVYVHADLLDRFNVELVDTPGTGSVYAHNTSAAEQIMDTLDAAVFVVSADPPISAAERDLLAKVGELSVHTFVVLNKADQLAPEDLSEAEAFTVAVCRQAIGHEVAILPCSAREGFDDAGYRRFADALEQYLADRADLDVTTALQGHLSRLASAMLDSALLTERSLQLTATTSADRVALFRGRADGIAARRRTLDDRSWAAERRVRRELDSAAFEQVASLSAQCRQEALSALDGALSQLSAEQIDAQGREVVVRAINAAAERWRVEHAHTLERELRELTEQAVADLESQLADLRAAAHELLDIELAASAVPHALRASQRFWYAFDRGVGWELPLAAAARNLLPGRVRRARERVLEEIPELVDRQIGRARADLAERLRESVRDVITRLRVEHDEVLARVRSALDEAASISGAAEGERDRRRTELTERTVQLRGVLEAVRENR